MQPDKTNTTPWVHFISICGVAMGQLAVEMRRNGWIVTGSDKGFFAPMSDHVKQNNINIELGFKKEHLTSDYYLSKYPEKFTTLLPNSHPDLVIPQGAKGENNEEIVHAKLYKLNIKYFPQIIQENVVRKNKSIVVAGTFGKTTNTAMIATILTEAKLKISYQIGGLAKNFENGIRFADDQTDWSVVEGDEYIVSGSIPRSKFWLYDPSHVLLTGIKWDHTDIFKTFNDYLDNFAKFLDSIPADGLLIYNEEDKNAAMLSKRVKCPVMAYRLDQDLIDKIRTNGYNPIADHDMLNALGAYTLTKSIGVSVENIYAGLKNFKGIKRRLEIVYESNLAVVIDDFGASPPKAKISLSSLRKKYPNSFITVIFEPNQGSRTLDGIDEYLDTFEQLENNGELILPRFTSVGYEYFNADQLKHFLRNSGLAIHVINQDEKLLAHISRKMHQKHVIAFMGSHGFRGLIGKAVQIFKT